MGLAAAPFVPVLLARLGADNFATKAPLAEAQLMIATGRRNGLSHSARSAPDRSGTQTKT